MRRLKTYALAVGILTVAMMLFVGPALAGKSEVTGTIAMMGPGETAPAAVQPAYGGDVMFDAEVYGKLANRSKVYITVVCTPGENVVYQYSSTQLDFAFPLADQAGQGLEWDGGSASCGAWLMYKVVKGRNTTITQLASVGFDVAGAG